MRCVSGRNPDGRRHLLAPRVSPYPGLDPGDGGRVGRGPVSLRGHARLLTVIFSLDGLLFGLDCLRQFAAGAPHWRAFRVQLMQPLLQALRQFLPRIRDDLDNGFAQHGRYCRVAAPRDMLESIEHCIRLSCRQKFLPAVAVGRGRFRFRRLASSHG
jgi:hypothetical protein